MTPLQMKLAYMGVDTLRISEVTYQIRYNGANFDLELLKEGVVVASMREDIEDELCFEVADVLIDKMLETLEAGRYDEECSSQGMKAAAAELGLQLVDIDNKPFDDEFSFEIGHDS